MNNSETISKINEIIESLRPYINMDGGDIKFIKYEDNNVYIQISGACIGCQFLDLTIQNGIYETLKQEIPCIKSVINIDSREPFDIE